MIGISWELSGYVWLYVAFWAIIQDAGKVLTYNTLQYFGWVESVAVIDERKLKDQTQQLFGVDVE
jgi:H+-transporting ATPase